jgi:hypothetical protein
MNRYLISGALFVLGLWQADSGPTNLDPWVFFRQSHEPIGWCQGTLVVCSCVLLWPWVAGLICGYMIKFFQLGMR